jgi:hypothetical protein
MAVRSSASSVAFTHKSNSRRLDRHLAQRYFSAGLERPGSPDGAAALALHPGAVEAGLAVDRHRLRWVTEFLGKPAVAREHHREPQQRGKAGRGELVERQVTP